jgi:hypothetical protein
MRGGHAIAHVRGFNQEFQSKKKEKNNTHKRKNELILFDLIKKEESCWLCVGTVMPSPVDMVKLNKSDGLWFIY